jgi:hypothetical protein
MDDPSKRTKRFVRLPAAKIAKPKSPKTKKRDFSQIVLSVMEKATGGPLVKSRKAR